MKPRSSARLGWRSWLFVVMGLAALAVGLYPSASQWWNSYLQAQALRNANTAMSEWPPERFKEIRREAEEYNQRLSAGLDVSDYLDQLNPFGNGLMGRIKIPHIDVDLPIYHTSNDAVLRKGAGHMPETSLPVGGAGTHAAITAHRGLAESVLFTHLDKVGIGDTFTLEILGVPQVYEVFDVRIVPPTESEWLKIDPNRDLVTLITCDPIGINTERILVTGERVHPTPQSAYDELDDDPGVRFPWWMVIAAAGIVVIALMARSTRTVREDEDESGDQGIGAGGGDDTDSRGDDAGNRLGGVTVGGIGK